MDIPKRALVICQDSECGNLNSIIINPKTHQTTHLVVEENYIPNHERVVPIELVEKTTSTAIYLACSKQEFHEMDNFKEHQYFPVEKSYGIFPIKQLAYVPYSSSESKKVADVSRERIPPGEINFPLEALEIRAIDGKIGKVNDLRIDEKTEKMTHIIASTGHWWAKKEITIPVSKIKNIDRNVVNLKIHKDELSEFTEGNHL
jgi:sporulation protein YlmC with PRC-barrel domain